jgi:hypothetical protein
MMGQVRGGLSGKSKEGCVRAVVLTGEGGDGGATALCEANGGGNGGIACGATGAAHGCGRGELGYHTRFLCQNRVLIVCMTQDQLFHTYGQKCSQITKCHNIENNCYINSPSSPSEQQI